MPGNIVDIFIHNLFWGSRQFFFYYEEFAVVCCGAGGQAGVFLCPGAEAQFAYGPVQIDVFGEYPVAFVLQMFFVGGNGLGGFVGYKFDAVLAAARRAWFELVEEFSAADQAETSGGHFVEIFFLGF